MVFWLVRLVVVNLPFVSLAIQIEHEAEKVGNAQLLYQRLIISDLAVGLRRVVVFYSVVSPKGNNNEQETLKYNLSYFVVGAVGSFVLPQYFLIPSPFKYIVNEGGNTG